MVGGASGKILAPALGIALMEPKSKRDLVQILHLQMGENHVRALTSEMSLATTLVKWVRKYYSSTYICNITAEWLVVPTIDLK